MSVAFEERLDTFINDVRKEVNEKERELQSLYRKYISNLKQAGFDFASILLNHLEGLYRKEVSSSDYGEYLNYKDDLSAPKHTSYRIDHIANKGHEGSLVECSRDIRNVARLFTGLGDAAETASKRLFDFKFKEGGAVSGRFIKDIADEFQHSRTETFIRPRLPALDEPIERQDDEDSNVGEEFFRAERRED